MNVIKDQGNKLPRNFNKLKKPYLNPEVSQWGEQGVSSAFELLQKEF